MRYDNYEIRILEHFATYVTYGDASHLLNGEQECADTELDRITNAHPGAIIVIGDDREEFARCEWIDRRGATVNAIVTYPVYDEIY